LHRLPAEAESKSQNLFLLLRLCSYWFTLRHRLQLCCKGTAQTSLPLHKTAQVSCHFSPHTFSTGFMLSKRLEKHVLDAKSTI